MELCCHVETPAEQEARQVASQLRNTPVNIWWHRRRVGGPQTPPTLANGADSSPFPKSWSFNYSGTSFSNRIPHAISEESSDQIQNAISEDSAATDASSVFSTVSQEQRLKRDANGFCIKHPHIQLAKRRQTRSYFMNILSKHKNQTDDTGEWETIHVKCPECEKDQIENSKTRYQYKPATAAGTQGHQNDELGSILNHVPFPATLTLINYNQNSEESTTLALRIRSQPIPSEETMHLSSCTAATAKNDSVGERINVIWATPDGALDSLLPADSNGNIIKETDVSSDNKPTLTPTKKKHSFPSSPYHIMERIIPLSSIDHVSRGGDAWDILRQSTGDNDFGCNCGVKIHGFSDRLLRFDVVNFDGIQSSQTNKNGGHRLRFSFAPVDFGQLSLTDTTNDKGAHADAGTSTHTGVESEHYTTENVISKLNTIVSWDRESREASAAHWMSGITNWLEEICSLGVTSVDDDDIDAQNHAAVVGKKNHIV